MPFNAIPNCVKVRFNYSFRGQQAINGLWFLKSAGSISLLDVMSLGDQLGTHWSDAVMPLLSSDLVFTNLSVRDMSIENGLEYVTGGVGPDGGAGDALPNNVAACVTIRTGFAGRHYRGRIYIPGIPRTAVAENEYLADFMSGLLVALTPIVGVDAIAAGWQLVVVAQEQVLVPGEAPVPIPGGIVTPAVSFGFSDDVVDSQRRRLPGRGK